MNLPRPVAAPVPPTALRVVVADDELRVRRGLAMRLALEPDLDVVGSTSDAEEAVGLAIATGADVVLLDVRMPPRGGLRVITRLRRELPDVHVVALSLHDGPGAEARARRAGADRFVSKAAGDAALLDALRARRDGTDAPPD